MSLYDASVPQFIRTLKNLEKWLDKAEAYAKARNFDAAVLLTSRLAPDQFHLIKQVQIAGDSAKNGLARLTGKQAPAQPDTDASFADLHARLQAAVAYLETFTPKDFEGVATRKVVPPGVQGKVALGRDHLFEHVIPTFFFHATTAYAILRHNGVDLGKADYLGERTLQEG